MKTAQLQKAMQDLKSGKTLKVKGVHGFGEIWLRQSGRPIDNNRHYIYWQHFGQSATRVTLTNLRWIFKAIFQNNTYNYQII